MGENGLSLWRERRGRLEKALRYEPVDRVPFTFLGPAYAPYSQGLPLSEFCTNPDAAVDVTIAALEDLGDIEGLNAMVGGLFPVMLTMSWLSHIDIPGRELPENTIWQVHEAEDMTVEDYDLILRDGWEAFLERVGPKVHHLDLLEEHLRWNERNYATLPGRYYERGYDVFCSAATTIPFEPLCGARSLAKFYADCCRMPDKVKAAMDVSLPWFVQLVVDLTDLSGVKRVWVGGWRSAPGMVGPKIWDELVFPYYLDLITQLDERGIFSVLHFDQNWDRGVHRFLELPRRSFAVAFDGLTDIRRAKAVLGDHCAFLGDVPASILASGTPDDVYRYVHDLIRDLGPTGLIMNSGCDIPYNAPPANVRAMVAATRDFAPAAA